MIDPITLTQELVRFNTINPPGQERECARHVSRLLEAGGFSVQEFDLAEGRTNLIARIGGSSDRPALCFTGHLDVVPLGAKPWAREPFAGETGNGAIHGRGTSDMKSGLAAFIVAALQLAKRLDRTAGLVLVITAAEETGCEGAHYLARLGNVLGTAGAIVVAEPTANAPWVGHKGALWLKAATSGVTAHASMPEQGVNALYKAARAVTKLENFRFGVGPHPVLGSPTLNVGTMRGGLNANSVPDAAEFTIDLRTIPEIDHEELRASLDRYLGAEVSLSVMNEAKSVWTDPENPWMREVFELTARVAGKTFGVQAAPYATDAAALTPAYGAPTVILGPGEPTLAHQTDELCRIDRLEQAVELYREIAQRWCRL